MTSPVAARRAVNKWGEGARLREEIVMAATRLIGHATSREAVTLRSIAREAGIATPSIYRHFADRDAVLDAVVSRTFEKLNGACAEAFEQAGTGMDRVRTISHAYVAFAADHRSEYRILFERAPANLDANPHPYPAGLHAFQYFVDAFEQMNDEGRASPDPVRDAQALWAALHGAVTLIPATPGFPWRPASELIDYLIDRIVASPAAGTS